MVCCFFFVLNNCKLTFKRKPAKNYFTYYDIMNFSPVTKMVNWLFFGWV